MGARFTKPGVDVGLVVTDSQRALAFYRDTLGMVHEGDRNISRGGVMHRLQCGDSLVKLLVFKEPPKARAPGGAITSAMGIRYLTLSVADVEGVLRACEAKGYTLPHAPYDNGHGLIVASVEDPDGNHVELVQDAATWRGRPLAPRP